MFYELIIRHKIFFFFLHQIKITWTPGWLKVREYLWRESGYYLNDFVFFKWFRLKIKIDLESDLSVENQWAQLKKQQQKNPPEYRLM